MNTAGRDGKPPRLLRPIVTLSFVLCPNVWTGMYVMQVQDNNVAVRAAHKRRCTGVSDFKSGVSWWGDFPLEHALRALLSDQTRPTDREE